MPGKYAELLQYLEKEPALYAESSHPFWNDTHISKYMLEAHLSPDTDAASRRPDFIKKSANWITDCCGGGQGKTLLDLGCGPGLYARLLTDKGFSVTGMDISSRSISYAQEAAKAAGQTIDYRCQNYLELDACNCYDAAILVYCDFSVLSPKDRRALLQKILYALKDDGVLILDVFGKKHLHSFEEKVSVQYKESGFWSPLPHALIQKSHFYAETDNTLEQYLIVTEDECRCYNIWDQVFTPESLKNELLDAGFCSCTLFDDIAGAAFTGKAETICITATKRTI